MIEVKMSGYYLHKEGISSVVWTSLLMVLVGTAAFMVEENRWLWWLLMLFCIFLWGIVVFFFRIPKRNYPEAAEDLLFAPADGKVVAIEQVHEPEYFSALCTKISIFMSPANVHVNRYPVSGKVVYCRYHAGKYLVAWHEKSSELNERNSVVVRTGQGFEVLVRQIAGAVARRIVHYAREGMEVCASEELGFIRFGSRVDLFFPSDATILVEKDQKVRGGISVLAKFE